MTLSKREVWTLKHVHYIHNQNGKRTKSHELFVSVHKDQHSNFLWVNGIVGWHTKHCQEWQELFLQEKKEKGSDLHMLTKT